MVELVNANHEVSPGQSKTVTFTIPAPANKTTAENHEYKFEERSSRQRPDLTFNLCECIIKENKMATLRAIRNNEPTTNASAARVDMKLEVVVIPVSDVDRAKEFYARLGWRLDAPGAL